MNVVSEWGEQVRGEVLWCKNGRGKHMGGRGGFVRVRSVEIGVRTERWVYLEVRMGNLMGRSGEL